MIPKLFCKGLIILRTILLLGVLPICFLTGEARADEQFESGTFSTYDKEMLDVETDAELRSLLSDLGQSLLPSDCRNWKEDAPRVVAIFDFRGHKELWIGKEYSDTDGLGVNGLQRTYRIKNVTRGGSPLRGSITIRLPVRQMDVERLCFEKLKGVSVRGVDTNAQGVYKGNIWEMRIREVSFGILVKGQGLRGEKVRTGEVQVMLKMSEELATMAVRKSVEHLWALPGSLGLMVLWAVGSRIWRRIRLERGSRMSDVLELPEVVQIQSGRQLDVSTAGREEPIWLMSARQGDETLLGIEIQDDGVPESYKSYAADEKCMILFARQDVSVRIVSSDCLVRRNVGHIRVVVEEIDLDCETEKTESRPKTYAVQTDRGDWKIMARVLIPEELSTSEKAETRIACIDIRRRCLQFIEKNMLQVTFCSSAVARITFESDAPQVFMSCVPLAKREMGATVMGKELPPSEQAQPSS